ncbi:MAG: energy-coupling factor ABC transporter ATP-binding protein [Deltaproteobacteria bacterium]|jgi:biotin transport system ATP-binding protein|nr:energy-coupling factor ABC transporter ATP-binding protein [Deltaproteobacteria bacterium]
MIAHGFNVCYRHPGNDQDTLKNLRFTFKKGEIIGLVGVNGSGKSTFLSLLAGLFQPTSGDLVVLEQDLAKNGAKFKGKVALVPQNPDIYILGSNVEEDLLLGVDPKDREKQERALALADSFGLTDLLKRPIHALSHGQKRKLTLASTLATQPSLLLLDEPFAGLDYPAILAIRTILENNKKAGITQVVVGHDLEMFVDLADSFALLNDGRIVAIGDAAEVFPHLLVNGARPPGHGFEKRGR